MADALTARQIQVLKSIIDEYIETADPVGSEALEKKYDLGVSPATIRNEMVALTKSGYLRQPHTSAGRIPSPLAMRFYIDQLMEEKQMSVAEEVRAKEGVWDVRGNMNSLLEEATQILAGQTSSLAVAAIDEGNKGKVWSSGYANVFGYPEFADVEICSKLFNLIEESSKINDLFFGKMGHSPIEVVFGEELGWSGFEPISIVGTTFKLGDKMAALGVIGPARAAYPRVIPTLRYFGNLIQEIATF